MTAKLSEVDQVLIRYGDTLSPNALSYKLKGILTPEQCAARLAVLLDAPDRLTALQQDQLVTLKMRQIVVELEELPRTTRNAEVILVGLEKVGNRLAQRQESTERELSQLYAFQGTVLLDAINVALAHMRGAVTQGNPLAEAQWDNALESALRFAQIELSKHEADVIDITPEPEAVKASAKATKATATAKTAIGPAAARAAQKKAQA